MQETFGQERGKNRGSVKQHGGRCISSSYALYSPATRLAPDQSPDFGWIIIIKKGNYSNAILNERGCALPTQVFSSVYRDLHDRNPHTAPLGWFQQSVR